MAIRLLAENEQIKFNLEKETSNLQNEIEKQKEFLEGKL